MGTTKDPGRRPRTPRPCELRKRHIGGHAAELLAAARGDLAAATANAEQLERALVSNRRIGMAIGILIERNRCTEAQAFDRLRDLSQRGNIKLREVAEQLIYTGDAQQRRD